MICADLDSDARERWHAVLRRRRKRRKTPKEAQVKEELHSSGAKVGSFFPESPLSGVDYPSTSPSPIPPSGSVPISLSLTPVTPVPVCLPLSNAPPPEGGAGQLVCTEGQGGPLSVPVTTVAATPWGNWNGPPWMPYPWMGFPGMGQGPPSTPWGWNPASWGTGTAPVPSGTGPATGTVAPPPGFHPWGVPGLCGVGGPSTTSPVSTLTTASTVVSWTSPVRIAVPTVADLVPVTVTTAPMTLTTSTVTTVTVTPTVVSVDDRTGTVASRPAAVVPAEDAFTRAFQLAVAGCPPSVSASSTHDQGKSISSTKKPAAYRSPVSDPRPSRDSPGKTQDRSQPDRQRWRMLG